MEGGKRKENTLSTDSALIASVDSDTKSAVDSASNGNLLQPSTLRSALPLGSAKNPHPKTYCIVLASYVSMRNANSFIERLQKQGFEQAEIFERNNIRRVIYGHYASENDAYNDLRRFHRQSETAEAWVMSM